MAAIPGGQPAGSTTTPTQNQGTLISTLIRNTRLFGQDQLTDVRLEGNLVAEIAPGISPNGAHCIVDADGGTLIPGLHDHHIHLVALAAALDSLRCGPPDIHSWDALATALRKANQSGESSWVRGIGYHPCVAGDIDRDWLDRFIPDRPVRLQHRGGRLWVLNSRALEQLHIAADASPPGLEWIDGRPSGRLYESDGWLRSRLNSQFPDLSKASALLASYGITGITDTSPANGSAEWQYFHQCQQDGRLKQRVRMMGGHELWQCQDTALLNRGEFKIHLLESQLPDLDALCADIARAHDSNRAVAIHCVTLTELVYALGALQAVGTMAGDRIEHASVTPPEQLATIRVLGLRVITQPNFIAERGDQYLAEVEQVDQPWLYRCAGFLDAGIPMAAGSDAPFGNPDPWRAMQAAIDRKTPTGRVMGEDEALTPEQALGLYLSNLDHPGTEPRAIAGGADADLCLLRSPWCQARGNLTNKIVRMTWRSGKLIYESGDS